MAVKPPKPSVEDACAAAEHFINHLADRRVRSFKGELLGADGAKLWALEVTFDREQKQQRDIDPRE